MFKFRLQFHLHKDLGVHRLQALVCSVLLKGHFLLPELVFVHVFCLRVLDFIGTFSILVSEIRMDL
jgi:hypothetical protein